MSGRLRFQVWTVPTAATFEILADNLPVMEGASGTVIMSDWTDANIAVPLDAPELADLVEGSLVAVYDGTTLVDEFFAERIANPVDRQATPFIPVSGPGINGGLSKIAVYPHNLPNDVDWIWGSDNNLLRNPGADDNPFGILNPGFEDGTRTPWWPGGLEGTSANLSVVSTAPRTGTWHALVAALLNEGGMSTGVRVFPGRTYAFSIWGRTDSGTKTWQAGASGPSALVAGSGAVIREHSDPGQFAPGHDFEAQIENSFGTTYAQLTLNFTAAADQRSSQVSVRLFHPGGAPANLYVDDITFTGFGVGVDPWEATEGVTAFQASTAVTPVDGTHHFLVTAAPNEGVFQGVGNFLPGETVTVNVATRGPSADLWSLELRDVRGTILGQIPITLTTGSWDLTNPLTVTLPDFIPGPDGEIQFWLVNRHTASSTLYFDAANFVRGFAAATAGEVFRLLLEAAYARGAGLWLELDATDTLDSDGATLPLLPAYSTGPPENLGHVGRNLSRLENGIEWEIRRKAAPSGTFTHDLKIYVKGGLGSVITDGSKAVIGVHAGSSIDRLPAFTAAGALGADGLWAEDEDAAAVSAYGRWERVFDTPHLASTDALADFLADAFDEEETNRTALQVRVRGDVQSVPLVDYRPGDTLPWIVPPYTTASRRVVTVSWRHADLAEYDVTGSKVFPGRSAESKAVEILWDEIHGRKTTRRSTAITRPEPPLPSGGGHPWWILATLGSSAEDRAIANVICDGVADNVDILDGLINHRNVWLCDSGDVDYRIDAIMNLGTDHGDLWLAGEPGSKLRLRDGSEGGPYNGAFFSYSGGGSPSIGKIFRIEGVTFDSNQQSNGVAWTGGGTNAQPFVMFNHCSFVHFDTFVITYERLMQWAFEQCLFSDCQPFAYIDCLGFISSDSFLIDCLFDEACTGQVTNNGAASGGTILVANNQLNAVTENVATGVIYSHNLHGQTNSPGDHSGVTGVTDANAIHDNVAAEISAITTKASPTTSDFLLIEDAAAGDAKKKITLGSLPGGVDPTAIHDNVAGEIAALTTVTAASGDFVLIEDVSDSNNKKKALASDFFGSGTDPDAIHDNVSGEINAITEKVSPVDGDWLLIEDSAASNVKKKIQIGNLPGGSGSGQTYEAAWVVPPTGGWSWVNQGGATISSANDRETLVAPAQGNSSNVRLRVRTAPSAPYVLTARLLPLVFTKNYLGASLVIRESGTGEFIQFKFVYASTQPELAVEQWTSPTSFSSSVRSVLIDKPIEWLQIEDNNTNHIFRVSRSGFSGDWIEVYSQSRTAWMATPDQIGFAADAQNVSTPNFDAILSILSWEEA